KAFDNQDVQFEDLVSRLNLERDPSRNPLFDISMVVQNFTQMTERENLQLPGEKVNLTPVEYKKTTSRFDMTFFIHEHEENLYITIEYYTGIFKEETVKRLALHLINVIKAVTREPSIKLDDIEIISEDEKHRLLYEFNDTAREYPSNKTLHGLFEEESARRPDSIAVVGYSCMAAWLHGEVYITYHELSKKSQRLAYLLKEKGVLADDIIGIMVERSAEMVIGILGILKAGGAYLPLDPDYPGDRISFMLADSGAKILLAAPDTEVKVKAEVEEKFIEIVDISNLLSSSTLTSTSRVAASEASLAYIIYTSGSTGKPKGVVVEHRALVNLCYWHNRFYEVTGRDKATQYASISFDAAVWEIFPYLIKGASLHFIDDGIKLDILQLRNFFEKHCITIGFLPTRFCEQFLEELKEIPSLRAILTGGDKLNRFIETGCRLYNNYGPTENTVVTTSFAVDRNYENIPLGKPISNNRIWILNNNDNVQPVGIAGELCIGGPGLARGYLNRPELTAEKFIKGTRGLAPLLYRSGDLARWLPDGNIEFLGRIDQQVKIRDFRIELGEIESHLLAHHAINEAVVRAWPDKTGDNYLCAYVTSEKEISIPGTRDHLSKKLPGYMIPSYFVQLEEIPLTPSGKVNRKALPTPGVTPEGEYAAPRNELEKKLVEIWSEVLKVEIDKIGIDDNFFQLGGHSLKATILVSRIHREFEVKIPLVEIFKTPFIRALALKVIESAPVKFLDLEEVEKKEYYEPSYNQKRLWIIYHLTPGSSSYHMPGLIRLDHVVNIEVLKKALSRIFERHESFRTGFKEIHNQPVQFIRDQVEIPFRVMDISGMADAEKQEKTGEIMRQTTVRPFDLQRPPLFRSVLIKQNNEDFVLVYNMHHIISDGWSMGILRNELNQLYDDYLKGKDPSPEPVQFQYKDFAHWHNRQIRDQGHREQAYQYWQGIMGPGFPTLKLPYCQTENYEDRIGAAYRCVIKQTLKDRLQRWANQN
ncbi:MAG: amino acid adenylation domain-containing protein, partial [Candidatus Aminicenantes bacterium]